MDGAKVIEEWYSNKDLFEMVQGLRDEMRETRSEMKETRAAVKQYNNLREQISQCQKDILTMQEQTIGKKLAWTDIRIWGSWLVAISSFIYSVLKGR